MYLSRKHPVKHMLDIEHHHRKQSHEAPGHAPEVFLRQKAAEIPVSVQGSWDP
jgi:hypothetical protein